VNGDDPNGGAFPPWDELPTICLPTVQDAVDAAVSGDRINVCPGLYTEQVTIPVERTTSSTAPRSGDGKR